jgi:hypothetical protein
MPDEKTRNGKKPNGYIDREASKLPYTRCSIDGRVIPVKLGAIGWVFVIATLGVIGSYPFLSKDVLAGEATDEKIKQDIETIHQNQGTMDENQRETDQSVRFAIQQLQALIEANPNVHGPTELPPLAESELEDLSE